MTLADIQRQCHVLARTVRIVREQLWAGGASEAIQDIGTPAFDQMTHLQCTSARLLQGVAGVSIDLGASFLQQSGHAP